MSHGPARFWYSIRVSQPGDWTLDKLVEYVHDGFLDEYSPTFLATYEVGKLNEGPHLHIYARSAYKPVPFRNHWRRALPDLCGGNGFYSIKAGGDNDDDRLRFLRYICKGSSPEVPPIVVLNQGFTVTDEDVARYHREFYENAPNPGTPCKSGKDRSPVSLVEQLTARCKRAVPSVEWDDCDRIVREYVGLCVEKRRRLSKFEAEGVCLGVRAQLCPDDSFENRFIQSISERTHI